MYSRICSQKKNGGRRKRHIIRVLKKKTKRSEICFSLLIYIKSDVDLLIQVLYMFTKYLSLSLIVFLCIVAFLLFNLDLGGVCFLI